MSPDLGETDLDGERVFAESPQRAAEKWAADRRGSAGGTRPLRVKVFKVGESRCHWFEVDKEVTSAWHAHATGAPTEATRPAPPYLYVVR